MNGYQCWFCGHGIERTDKGAVMIGIEGLWHWAGGSRNDDAPYQAVYAHSGCAKARMQGATMDLEPGVFGDDESGGSSPNSADGH